MPAPTLTLIRGGAAWEEQAACRTVDSQVFFPTAPASAARQVSGSDQSLWSAARKICWSCPSREACLEHAMASDENEGMWGGLTPRERERLRAERRHGGG